MALPQGTVTRTVIGPENTPTANITCSVCGLVGRLVIDPSPITPHPLRSIAKDFWKLHITLKHETNIDLDTSIV